MTKRILSIILSIAVLLGMIPTMSLTAFANTDAFDGEWVSLTTYTVTVDSAIAHGTVTSSAASVSAGTAVTLTVTPEDGYSLASGTLKVSDGTNEIELTSGANNTYTFTMPAANVTVSARFGIPIGELYYVNDDDNGVTTFFGYGTLSAVSSLASTINSNVVLEEGITTIGNYAFRGCSSIESITIPASVTAIGRYAFQGCASLTDVTYLGTSEPTTYANSFDEGSLSSVTVPAGYTGDTFADIAVVKSGASTPTTNVASVTVDGATTNYTDLESAFAAARGATGTSVTLTLLEDVTTEDSISVTGGKFTFDLNGKTLQNTKTITMFVDSDVELTIKDSSTGGTIETLGDNCSAIMNHGSLTIQSGTIKSTYTAIDDGGSLTINGGTIDGADHSVYIGSSSNTVIHNGTFKGNVWGFAGYTVNGGDFECNDIGINAENGVLEIKDGTFNIDQIKIYKGTVSLSGGTFSNGIEVWDLMSDSDAQQYASSLLADGYAYYDANGAVIIIEDTASTVSGEVTVGAAQATTPTVTGVSFNENSPAYNSVTNTFNVSDANPFILTITGERLSELTGNTLRALFFGDAQGSGGVIIDVTIESDTRAYVSVNTSRLTYILNNAIGAGSRSTKATSVMVENGGATVGTVNVNLVYAPVTVPVDAAIEVTKDFADWDKAQGFTFILEAVTAGAPMPEDYMAFATEAAPLASFGNITFESEGTYKYTIIEVDDGIPGITYDTTAHEVVVTVTRGDDNSLTASVKYDGKDGLVITNTYMKPAYIAAVDVADGTEIQGATIQLLDEQGDIVDEWVSTVEAHEVFGLIADEIYTVHNTVAPIGYTIATDTQFCLDQYGTVFSTGSIDQYSVILVEFAMTEVSIAVVDFADSAMLEGATVQITDVNGDLVEEWVSTTEAYEVIGLETNKVYTVRTTVTPNGYDIPTEFQFTLDENGNITCTGSISADGMILVELAKTLTNVASVTVGGNTTNYADLEEAFEAAAGASGSTLTLLDNISRDKAITVTSGNFTVDLNGKTWECTNGRVIDLRNDAKLRIVDGSTNKNGKLLASNNGTPAISMRNNAELEIAGGTVESMTSYAVDMSLSGNATSAKLVISGGKLITNGNVTIFAFGSSITITSGTFEHNDSNSAAHIYFRTGAVDLSGHPDPSGINIAVSHINGDVTIGEDTLNLPNGYVMLDYYGEAQTTLVNGYLYEVGKATVTPEVKWGASADALTNSGTLAEAIAANAAYIQLQKDITSDSMLEFNSSVTIDLNGKTLTANVERDDGVYVDGDLTLTDSSTVQSGSLTGKSTTSNGVHVHGSITVESGSLIGESDEGYGVICPFGDITVESGSLTGKSSDNYGVYVSLNLTISGGELSGTGYGYGVLVNNGNLTVESGSLSGTAEVSNGAGVSVGGNITVSGESKLTATGATAIYIGDEANSSYTKQSETTDSATGLTTVVLVAKQVTSTYIVTVNTAENGTVTADKTEAAEGDTVTLTVTPDENYELDTLTVTDSNDDTVTVENNTFTVPAGGATVTATFRVKHATIIDLNDAIKALEEKIAAQVDPDELAAAIKNVTDLIGALDNTYATDAQVANDIEAAKKAVTDAYTKALDDAVKELEEKIAAQVDPDELAAEIKNVTDLIDSLDNIYATDDQLAQAVATAKSTLEALIGDVQSDLDTTKANLDKAIKDLNKAIADGDNALSDEIDALEKALDDAKAALEQADADNKAELVSKIEAADAALDAAIKVVQTNLDNAKAELEKAIADLDAAMKKGDADLSTEIANLNTALEKAKAALEQADADNKAELVSKIETADAALDAAIKVVQTNLDNAKAELERAIAALNTAMNKSDAYLSAEIASLHKALVNAKAALETADAENKTELEGKITSAQTALQAAIDSVQTNLDNAKAELNKAIADGDAELDDKLTALSEALAVAKAALEAADTANKSELTTKIDEAYASLDAAVKAVQKNLDDLKAALEAKDSELAKADAENKAALEAKDAELQIFIIIVCVISCVAFLGCCTLAIVYFIDKKKKSNK